MKAFLDHQGVLLKNFDRYVATATEKVKAHAKRLAADAGRPYLYLAETHTKSRGQSKEELARQIAERDRIAAGLICVLAAVEPCGSFSIFKNKDAHCLELVRRRRKCLHFYFVHAELGFCLTCNAADVVVRCPIGLAEGRCVRIVPCRLLLGGAMQDDLTKPGRIGPTRPSPASR